MIPENQVTGNAELKKEVSEEKKGKKTSKTKKLSRELKDKVNALSTDSSHKQDQRKTLKMAQSESQQS